MSNRLTKIVTKAGDDGTTALASGKRISKADVIIAAIGTIDELNSSIGFVRCVCQHKDLDNELMQLQQNLFNCGADLCLEGSVLISSKQIKAIEYSLEEHNKQLAALEKHILTAGNELVAPIQIART
ncbi:ATP:Cob(I)alamin adenosyltransferase, partial [hydrothermal vent metagenome]